MMLLDEFIECGQGVALENRRAMASGQRGCAAGFSVPRQPLLKGSDIDPVKSGDLHLSTLMVQVSRYGSLASLCRCYSHTKNTKQILRFFNR